MSGIVTFNSAHRYNLDDNNKIETSNGMVYFSQDLDLMRRVLIKVTQIEGRNKNEINTALKKAMSEVRAMVAVEDERLNIPRIHNTFFDEKELKFYVVMEFIKGQNLKQLMNTASEENFIRWMAEIAKILSTLEKKRIYHKDIKPDNIMIGPKNEAYLIDFDISVSTPNQYEGTMFYKAPEMDRGSAYPGRDKVDMFSLGVIMYEFYTGKLPKRPIDYSADASVFSWKKFIEPKEKNPGMNSFANDCIVKCMKMNPKERYRDNNELAAQLYDLLRRIRSDGKSARNARTDGT